MKLKLQFASLLTIGLLSEFVLAIILAASYFAGYISWYFMIGIIVVFNFVMWLVGPYISDLIYRWFYKIEFYNYEQIKDKPYAKFIKKICDEHHIKVPKIGIIKDMNPTAFTYGSAACNARVVVTEGLFNFLDEKEIEAVVAHELGHIVNRDFIIMTIAATLLEILYQLYVIFARARARGASFSRYGVLGKSGSKKEGSGYLVVIGYISLLFYWIGTYTILFLSRLREYYADEFSAKKTKDPNLLSSALVKIAYGIATVPDTTRTAHLLNATRAQGIFDFKAAKEVGLVYQNSKNRKGLIERALLFDIVSPWAWILQLKSTHPLIGKRIKRLCSMTNSPAFDFESILNKGFDRQRLWKNFFGDVLIVYSIPLTVAVFIITGILQFYYKVNYYAPTIAVFFALLIILSIIKIRYRLPLGNFAETDVIDCMADIYASPIRGKPVRLSGKAIGRGQAGFIFGEDMIFQDKTGIIYLNYEAGIPIFGNLFFAWKKLEKLLMKPATINGWFLRGASHHIELYNFKTSIQTIKSYVRFWTVAGLVLNIIIYGFLAWVILSTFNII